MTTIRAFLWFTEGAEEALELYARAFAGSEATAVRGPGEDGTERLHSGTLRVGDTELLIFNGGPYADFRFSPATSLFITAADQAEVDALWEVLGEGGEPGRCGWLTDRFGVTWQVVPTLFNELMSSEDPGVRERVTAAMMKMGKFDCAALQAAADAR